MAARDGLYSRFVAWMKILLPLASLVLLSTLFLLSRSQDNTGDLPFNLQDLQERARAEQVSEPRFAGSSTSGDLLSFVASAARPDGVDPHLAHADRLTAQIDFTNGSQITFASQEGLVDTRAQLARLKGAVEITSSTGYRLTTEELTTEMAAIGAYTAGPVQGEGPAGQLNAGKMRLDRDPETGNVHLLFTNRVKLIYQPGN